jgi:hypothetical protein
MTWTWPSSVLARSPVFRGGVACRNTHAEKDTGRKMTARIANRIDVVDVAEDEISVQAPDSNGTLQTITLTAQGASASATVLYTLACKKLVS